MVIRGGFVILKKTTTDLMESIGTLKEEPDQEDQEVGQISTENNQSLQNGLVSHEKGKLQTKLKELEALFENVRQELEGTRVALAKLQKTDCANAASDLKTEKSSPLESPFSDSSVNSQVIIRVESETKQISTQTPDWENAYKIFVGNLSNRASGSDIRKLFETHGTVLEADVIRNYGFVHMENEDEGQMAIETLNGYSLHGKTKKWKCINVIKILLRSGFHIYTHAKINFSCGIDSTHL